MFDLSQVRTCHLAGTLGQGGAERQLFYALRALRQNGAAPYVLTLEPKGFWEEPIKELGVEVEWIGQSRSHLARLFRFVKKLRKRPLDIIQAQHFFTNAYASLAGFLLRRKAIGALRSNGRFEMRDSGPLGGRVNLRLPRLLAANSRHSIDYAMNQGVAASRLYFLPNVVDTDRFRPAADPVRGSPVLVAAGRLTPVKRFDRFLLLLHRVRKEHQQDVRGLIVGSRSDKSLLLDLQNQASELGLLPGLVQFAGSVGDMAPIYHEASLFVLTSDHEGTPNVLLEAMASELPVVATNVGGVSEIVDHGKTGFLVEPEGMDAMVGAVSLLLRDPKLRMTMGTRARSWVEATHSLNRLPTFLGDLYDFALRGNHSVQGKTTIQLGLDRGLSF